MDANAIVKQYWADVSLLGASMPFVETMALVQKTSGTGLVESWDRGLISPRLFDVYGDFADWSRRTGRTIKGAVLSVAEFVEGSEALGCQVKRVSRTWIKDETPSQDRNPTCLLVPGLKQLRNELGTAEYFDASRYDEGKTDRAA
jgi:hypothetical protein